MPLFFLDYFVCGKLDVKIAEAVVRGIAAGCRQAGCALIGGETAEHPGDFPKGEYDLAGFVVGVLEKKQIIDPASDRSGRYFDRLTFQRSAQQRLFAGAQGFARSGAHESCAGIFPSSVARSPKSCSNRRGSTPKLLSRLFANFASKARRISPAAALRETCRECCRNGGTPTSNGQSWPVPPVFELDSKNR